MVDGLQFTASIKAADNIQERLEKELLGAWRAGYKWLYIAPDVTADPMEGKTELSMTVSYKVLPTDRQLHHNPFDAPMKEYPIGEMQSIKTHDC